MAQKKKQSVWWMWTSLEGRTKPMCFKLASMRHKNQAWIRPTWWISGTTCSRACDSLQRLPACKGFQPAKAPSLQRPPLQRLTHGKDHAVHAKVADKAAAAKGLWSCGGRATWCGWSRKKHCSQSGSNPHAHDHVTACTHTNSTQHTQNRSKNYIHTHTLHSLKHMQQHTQQKHKCTEHIKFKLEVHK